MVDGAAMAHAVAGARAVEQIGRVAHALHAAGDDDIRRARAQKVVGDHGRLHARAAHLVDRRRARREGQPRADRRLTRRRLTLARRQHAAHQDFVDAVGGDPGPLDRGEIARAPSAGALTSFKSPRKPPIGVRAAPTMTMGSAVVMGSALRLPRSGSRDLASETDWRATPHLLI